MSDKRPEKTRDSLIDEALSFAQGIAAISPKAEGITNPSMHAVLRDTLSGVAAEK